MKIVITGATGFIGEYLVSALSPKHDLECFVRDPRKARFAHGINIIQGDLADLNFTRALPQSADAIVHLAQANATFPERANELFTINTLATQRLANYAREVGVSHFVFASSGSVYARSMNTLSETSERRSVDFYCLTKNFSEDLLRFYKGIFNVCILRLFVPYGPGQKNRMIPKIIYLVRERKPVVLYNDGQPKINPIYVDDLVGIVDRCLTLSGHHIINVAGPRVINIRDIATIAARVLGVEPIFEYRHRPENSNLIADTNKLNDLFELGPLINPVEGIARTVIGSQ